jgi:NCAIR mutase (PurE)-related protein
MGLFADDFAKNIDDLSLKYEKINKQIDSEKDAVKAAALIRQRRIVNEQLVLMIGMIKKRIDDLVQLLEQENDKYIVSHGEVSQEIMDMINELMDLRDHFVELSSKIK